MRNNLDHRAIVNYEIHMVLELYYHNYIFVLKITSILRTDLHFWCIAIGSSFLSGIHLEERYLGTCYLVEDSAGAQGRGQAERVACKCGEGTPASTMPTRLGRRH